MTTTYSAFFSSGLRARPTSTSSSSRPRGDSTSTMTSTSSSDTIDDASDVEDAVSLFSSNHGSASIHAHPHDDTRNRKTSSTSRSGQPHTVRKRKSSVSLGVTTSPVAHLRSPARAVENALSFQRHVNYVQGTPSKSRSRSGSTSGNYNASGGAGFIGEVASMGTSLIGRMRSASVGAVLKPRRTVRRIPNNPLPPPSVPLPPLPPLPPKTPQRIHGRSFSLAPNGNAPSRGGFHGQGTALPPVPATPPDMMVDSPRTPLGDIQHTYRHSRMEED
ncbi:hypothetical protein L218DRAFT_1080371 [Marasmius fiardii PR-910]|nr:hypothetical protein L218DRAFT_1080371 [Marasmius fiardii PR-910]